MSLTSLKSYRKALRMMYYADHHGFSIVTFIDTPGAFADLKSEELAQGEAIAHNLRIMFGLKVPIVSIVIGKGGYGGALAIGCCNTMLMHENSVFYVASNPGFLRTMRNIIVSATGPKYDGKYLRSIVKEILGDMTMNQTLTDVIIPTFDIKRLQPVMFSTDEASKSFSKNAYLSNVCVATSATPTYLPAHYFETKYEDGRIRSFDLIDGGIAANNPTQMATTHITNEILRGNFQFVDTKPMDTRNMLVLSLGTGTAKHEEKYNATKASKWGLVNWVFDNGDTPLIDAYGASSADMVDIQVSSLFQALSTEKNYLRIQDDNLTGDASSVDIATTKNMEDLTAIGNELLKKPVSRVNIDTGLFEPVAGEGTNSDALTRFAKMLSDERKVRLAN